MLKENKKIKIILASLFILGGLLILLSYVVDNQSLNIRDNAESVESIETKLENFILNIDGIYQADVIINMENYFDKDAIYTFADNDDKIYYSKVNGVCVACTGGNNDKIKKEVTDIVTAYLGIGANKVKITGIKK